MANSRWFCVARKFDRDAFAKVAAEFGQMVKPLEEAGILLTGDYGHGRPTITERRIKFNGAEGSGCEPFVLSRTLERTPIPGGYIPQKEMLFDNYSNEDCGTNERNPPKMVGKYFQSCKTRDKPYELAIDVCLLIAKHHLGSDIFIPDYDEDEWIISRRLCQKVLGYESGTSPA